MSADLFPVLNLNSSRNLVLYGSLSERRDAASFHSVSRHKRIHTQRPMQDHSAKKHQVDTYIAYMQKQVRETNVKQPYKEQPEVIRSDARFHNPA